MHNIVGQTNHQFNFNLALADTLRILRMIRHRSLKYSAILSPLRSSILLLYILSQYLLFTCIVSLSIISMLSCYVLLLESLMDLYLPVFRLLSCSLVIGRNLPAMHNIKISFEYEIYP